jgi:hypothetical protein
MSDIAVTIDRQTGDKNCLWCEALFSSVNYQAYCSSDCRKEMTALRQKKRYKEDYTYVPEKVTGLFYRDYINENDKAAAKYGITPPPEREVVHTMKPIKVPEFNFKRFKEGKAPLVLAPIQRPGGWDNE